MFASFTLSYKCVTLLFIIYFVVNQPLHIISKAEFGWKTSNQIDWSIKTQLLE